MHMLWFPAPLSSFLYNYTYCICRFFVSRCKHCKYFSGNTAQKEGDRRKRTNDRDWTRDLHSFAELQPQAIGPVANPGTNIRRWESKDLRLWPIACGWSSAKECRSWVVAGLDGLFSPVAFLLSSVSREILTTTVQKCVSQRVFVNVNHLVEEVHSVTNVCVT